MTPAPTELVRLRAAWAWARNTNSDIADIDRAFPDHAITSPAEGAFVLHATSTSGAGLYATINSDLQLVALHSEPGQNARTITLDLPVYLRAFAPVPAHLSATAA